jgi:hypothetical protein
MQRLRAGKVQHRLVDRQRLDHGRETLHQRAYLPRGSDVFAEIGTDHHGVRARFQRLEHRHGGAHAGQPRDVAGGANHAAGAAADDHRFRCQFRPVALFDAGVKCIAIDMRDGKAKQFRVADDPPATTPSTSDH